MAENGPPGVRLIEVKPAVDDGKILPLVKSKNANAVEKENITERKKVRVFTMKPQEVSEHERQIAEIDSSFREVEMTYANHARNLPIAKEERVKDTENGVTGNREVKMLRHEIAKKKKRIKKNSVLPLDVTTTEYLEGNYEERGEEFNIGEPANRNGKKKKKAKKKDKMNTKKIEKNEPIVQATESKREPEQEIVIAPSQNGEQMHVDDNKNTGKLPCCFGFISTWSAKRKQKRREKKRKAIAIRANTPKLGDRAVPPKLVQYEHKKAKGGEAFVIEVDGRPIIQKPLLPPIKQTAGPIRRGIDQRLQKAEARRVEELAKRQEVGRNYERKKIECKERKADADYNFRKKAGLTIRYKQADAERNRNNLSRLAITTMPTSVQSSSCESVIIESDPDAFKVDESDPDAWKVDVDCFSF